MSTGHTTPAAKRVPRPLKITPPDVPDKPLTERGFDKPVAWLLGRQFIRSLKWIALYAAYKGKLDPRDWMQPSVIEIGAEHNASGDEFWFDYIADTGDGQLPTYNIAYLCLSDIWVRGGEAKRGDDCKLAPDATHDRRLPRGEFLFVGGDTGYHVADYTTLARQFQTPFTWAFKELSARGGPAAPCRSIRPILGIPGNHDYYDQLDGFNRQFRRPAKLAEKPRSGAGPKPKPLLKLPGFSRLQETSYVALRLPHGWWFWGLDTESNAIDFRQREFFCGIAGRSRKWVEDFEDVSYAEAEAPDASADEARHKVFRVPKRLIVATPEPTTYFGKYAEEDARLTQTFKSLGLEPAFLERNDGRLAGGMCRLDISGNYHYYARYWGDDGRPPERGAERGNYASVVSGLGGAFLHPSQTRGGPLAERAIYPKPADSRLEVAKRIFKPWKIATGGYIWLVGALLALIIYAAGAYAPSTRGLFDHFVLGRALGVTQQRVVELTSPLSWREAGDAPLQMTGVSEQFAGSLKLLGAFAVAMFFGVLAIRYPKKLFEKTFKRPVGWWEYLPMYAWTALAAATLCAGVWRYGVWPLGATVFDIVFTLAVVLTFVGLVAAAVFVGGEFYGVPGKVGFAALGLVHAVLQIASPFLILRLGDLRALWAVGAAILVFVVIGHLIVRSHRLVRWRLQGPVLLAAWLLYGAAVLAAPLWRPDLKATLIAGGRLPLALFVVWVGFFGALMSCIWFGWYVAVSLAFDGHNNEAGGAARIEKFKQLIRFRIDRDGLTGYVIGFKDPKVDAGAVKATLVDVFHVRPRPEEPGGGGV
jgi:hypothetical protein